VQLRDQRMKALAKANEIRLGQARVRMEIRGLEKRASRRFVADLLEARDPRVQSMSVGQLLTTIQYAGRKKSGRWLRSAGVLNGFRPVRDLTDRQVAVIVEALREDAERMRSNADRLAA
jgi:hypothetical protein